MVVVYGFAVDLHEFASLNLNLTADRSQSGPLNSSAQATELDIWQNIIQGERMAFDI